MTWMNPISIARTKLKKALIADELQQSESSVDDLSEAGEQDAVDLIESSSLQEDLAVDSNWDDVFELISMDQRTCLGRL